MKGGYHNSFDWRNDCVCMEGVAGREESGGCEEMCVRGEGRGRCDAK